VGISVISVANAGRNPNNARKDETDNMQSFLKEMQPKRDRPAVRSLLSTSVDGIYNTKIPMKNSLERFILINVSNGALIPMAR
jgi:hypothetical protein